MAKICSVFRGIFSLVFVAVIILLSMAITIQLTVPEKAIDVFGFRLYLISYTKSMEPILHYNDLILVRRYDFDSLEVGDVITFTTKTTDNQKITITHTVDAIYTDPTDGARLIQTKGANIAYPDSIVVTNDGRNGTNVYQGKYAGKSEFLGNLIAFLKSGPGTIVIIVNTVCLILIFVILNRRTAKK